MNNDFIFILEGCDFRWKILKMAFQSQKPTSIQSLINNAEELKDWVNLTKKHPELELSTNFNKKHENTKTVPASPTYTVRDGEL